MKGTALALSLLFALGAAAEVTPPQVLDRAPLSVSACPLQRGEVVVEATISESGKLEDIRVLTPASPCVQKAAASALSQWRFAPAMRDGKPMATKFRLTFNR